MWEVDYKESSVPKNWCFWTVMLEKTLENPLFCKDIKPVNPKGNQSSIFIQFSSVQLLSLVQLFVTLWTAAHQASLSTTNSWSLLKLMSIELVMPSNHFILCRPPFLLPSVFPSIRVFSNESALQIRRPNYWHFSFSINPSNVYSGLTSLGSTGLISLQSKGFSRVFSGTTAWKHQFFGAQPSLWSNAHNCTWLLEKP